ncbi:MAG: GNAT family N-acetyltransferase [Dehalococcoidales bacterium]|nr:GNAT family N-acetyltransferase [Dehalococcoidales bacterium]
MVTERRIRLRQKKLSDAREDYAWQTDPELCRLDAAEVLKMSYQQYLADYTFELCYPTTGRYEFAIENLHGEHIGNCVYYNVDTYEGKAELGIMIGNRAYWNQGYGKEAVDALLDHIFQTTRLEKVYLTTLEWNLRAQKCFKKCGFTPCGKISRDGSVFLMMVIHRSEWEKLREKNSQQENFETSSRQNPPEVSQA